MKKKSLLNPLCGAPNSFTRPSPHTGRGPRDDPAHKSSHADAIGLECADVANMAMMIADNAGALKGSP